MEKESVKKEDVVCWECKRKISPFDKIGLEREECTQCFAAKDGPYDDNDQEDL